MEMEVERGLQEEGTEGAKAIQQGNCLRVTITVFHVAQCLIP